MGMLCPDGTIEPIFQEQPEILGTPRYLHGLPFFSNRFRKKLRLAPLTVHFAGRRQFVEQPVPHGDGKRVPSVMP